MGPAPQILVNRNRYYFLLLMTFLNSFGGNLFPSSDMYNFFLQFQPMLNVILK